MVQFSATILKFGEKGEKTGWYYIEVPAGIAAKLNPEDKKSFRVSGKLDEYTLEGTSLIPMGGGNYILALNAAIRRGIRKTKGAMLKVQLTVANPYEVLPELLECLNDEPEAKTFFMILPRAHQNYFSKWIESAKTEVTRAKRIAMTVNAASKKWGFSEMIRASKKNDGF
ncbi:MAG: DUF1905 domain-containing protein [Bacteroidetes bacterium]|nr:DUF1905 domain-containing protein [Bacteroidota bacterium]